MFCGWRDEFEFALSQKRRVSSFIDYMNDCWGYPFATFITSMSELTSNT